MSGCPAAIEMVAHSDHANEFEYLDADILFHRTLLEASGNLMFAALGDVIASTATVPKPPCGKSSTNPIRPSATSPALKPDPSSSQHHAAVEVAAQRLPAG